MMSYYELGTPLRIVLMLSLFLTLCGSVCLAPSAFLRKPILPKVLLPLCMLLEGGIMILYAADVRIIKYEMQASPASTWLCEKPVMIAVLFVIAVSAFLVYLFLREGQYRRNTLTPSSVKESLDHLATGLCFSYGNGRVVLVNHRMNELCHVMTGQNLQNADLFWRALSAGEAAEHIQCLSVGIQPRFRLPDGSVWTFAREDLGGLIQLTAADTTQLNALTEDLKEKNIELAAVNLRLKRYAENVEELTRAKERLETKVRIHNELGQVLLATRHCLLKEESSQKFPIDLWEHNIAMLRMEAETQAEEPTMQMLRSIASASGVTVETEGELPEQENLKKLMITATAEALTNAVRHAGAKTLRIVTTETEDAWMFCFQNDGRHPESEITEGGGLGALREKVESAGGTMRVSCRPEYSLSITFGKEVI